MYDRRQESPNEFWDGLPDYPDTDVHMLLFVRRSSDLGLSVAEIGDLLGLWRDETRQSSEIKQLAYERDCSAEAGSTRFQSSISFVGWNDRLARERL